MRSLETVKLLNLLLVEERSKRYRSDHGDRGADGGFHLDRGGAPDALEVWEKELR